MKDKIIFIGDSLTFGYGIKKVDTWVSRISNCTSFEIINKGINGSTTTDMLDRFYEDVLIHNPKKVFLMGGTNDLLCNHSIYSVLENMELMIKDCISKDIEIFIGIPPTIIPSDAEKLFMPSPDYTYCNNNLVTLREDLLALCTSYNCTYIDFYTLTLSNIKKNIFFDGIHLNVDGQDLMFNYAKDYFI